MQGPNTILCPYCQAEISATATKCQYCGEWVRGGPPQGQAAPVQQHVTYVQAPESVAFAVVTLIFLIVFYPIGVILNLVGLLTGPRRGCFLGMFLLFIALPIAIFVAVVLLGVVNWPEVKQWLEEVSRSA